MLHDCYPFSSHVKGLYCQYRGRISASTFTAALAAWLLVNCAVGILLFRALYPLFIPAVGYSIMIAYVLVALYGLLGLMVKRCHDLDRSATLSLMIFIPVVNILFMIYLSLMRGSGLSNRFGPPDTYFLPGVLACLGYPTLAFCLVLPVFFIMPDLFSRMIGVKKERQILDFVRTLPLPEPARRAILFIG